MSDNRKADSVKYVKVLNANKGRMVHRYHLGVNDVRDVKTEDGKPFRIWFTDIENVTYYLNYGPIIAEISIPSQYATYSPESDYDEDGHEILVPAYYSKMIDIISFRQMNDISTIKWLVENGSVSKYDTLVNLYEWAILHSVEGFDYLTTWLNDNCSKDMRESIIAKMSMQGYL